MRSVNTLTVLTLLAAAGLTSAWAQQSVPTPPAAAASAAKSPLSAASMAPVTVPRQSAAVAPALAASTPKPPSPMINRWVDAHGQVHYSDRLPSDAHGQVDQIGPLDASTPEQKAQADMQLEQYRDYLDQSATTSQPVNAPQAPQAPETAPEPLPDNGATGLWISPDQQIPRLRRPDRHRRAQPVGSDQSSGNRPGHNPTNPSPPETHHPHPSENHHTDQERTVDHGPSRKQTTNPSQGQSVPSSSRVINRPTQSGAGCQSQSGAGCRP